MNKKIENILFIFLNNEIRKQNLSVGDIAYFLKVSKRTVYRYLKIIERFKRDFNFPF